MIRPLNSCMYFHEVNNLFKESAQQILEYLIALKVLSTPARRTPILKLNPDIFPSWRSYCTESQSRLRMNNYYFPSGL